MLIKIVRTVLPRRRRISPKELRQAKRQPIRRARVLVLQRGRRRSAIQQPRREAECRREPEYRGRGGAAQVEARERGGFRGSAEETQGRGEAFPDELGDFGFACGLLDRSFCIRERAWIDFSWVGFS